MHYSIRNSGPFTARQVTVPDLLEIATWCRGVAFTKGHKHIDFTSLGTKYRADLGDYIVEFQEDVWYGVFPASLFNIYFRGTKV